MRALFISLPSPFLSVPADHMGSGSLVLWHGSLEAVVVKACSENGMIWFLEAVSGCVENAGRENGYSHPAAESRHGGLYVLLLFLTLFIFNYSFSAFVFSML